MPSACGSRIPGSCGLRRPREAVGGPLPDSAILRPATPPPDFDLDLALQSLRRFADRSPSGIALAHYGLVPDPMATLDEAADTLQRWATVAEQAWRTGEDIVAALEAAFDSDYEGVDPDQVVKLQT